MTKRQRKSEVRAIIYGYDIGQTFSAKDVLRMSELCGYEFGEISRIPAFAGSGGRIEVTHGDYRGPWSWIKSIDGYDERVNLLQAMRSASRVGTFANVVLQGCAVCGSTEDLTVDHKTVAFSVIATRFIEKHGSPKLRNSERGWELCDSDGSRFLVFHDEIADYQVLCRSCNSKKGS